MRALWKFLASDCLLKVISVLLACVIWFYVTSERSQEIEIPVMVTIVAPENTILLEPLTSTVPVSAKVKGPSDQIARIPRPLEVVFQIESTTTRIEIDERMLKLPEGVRLISPIRPIPLRFDTRSTVSYPVSLVFTGSLPPGYIEGDHDFSPRTASITGPSEVLSQFDAVETTPIDINGKTSSFIVYVRVRPKSHADKISVEDTLIRVAVSISPVEGRRTFRVPVQISLPPGFGFQVAGVTPPEVEIVVRGPEAKLAELDARGISVLLNVGFLKVRGIHKELLTQVILPPGFSLAGDPPRVDVQLN